MESGYSKTPELSAAIERVYEAFGAVPKPLRIEGCPCCIEAKGVDVLLARSLREITPDELSEYAASVFLTIGCLDDFLYLLPRILEILAAEPFWRPSPEIVAKSLLRGGIASWPEPQRSAVHGYFNAILEDRLQRPDSDPVELDSWMCALGILFSDVTPYLDRLAGHRQKFLGFYEANSACLIKGRLANGFWEDDSKTRKQVIDWFNSSRIKADIEAAYRL